MRSPEEVARESLGNIAGPLRRIFRDAGWLDALDVLIVQEAEHLADLIRARDTEVAARALRDAADVDDMDHATEVALGGLDYVQNWLRHRADRIEREGTDHE